MNVIEFPKTPVNENGTLNLSDTLYRIVDETDAIEACMIVRRDDGTLEVYKTDTIYNALVMLEDTIDYLT